MDARHKEVLTAFHQFWNIWAKREKGSKSIEDLIPLFDKNVTALGTGEHEKGRDYEEVVQNFQDDFNEVGDSLGFEIFYEKARLLSETVGLVEAEAYVYIETENHQIIRFHLRFSTILTWQGNKWLVSHNHVSVPYDGQNVGEAYPMDKLKAQNDRLQKEVNDRTRKLEERTLQLQEEKEKTEGLLYNILPKQVARELISTGKTVPARYENASVLFTDFIQFTRLAASITPRQLVEELNEIFYSFDNIIKEEKLEKIKTIGDSYMAVCGLPEENEQHAFQCIQAAKRMVDFLHSRNDSSGIKWKMRIGIHSGPVVAGVVGNHKFTYDLWGNTVNIASRLETAGREGMINISEQTYSLIRNHFNCEYRGKIKVKGAEEIDMYFVF